MLKPFFDKNLLEAGCDEAGRGCLAGPVFAAAVIFNKKYRNKWLNDSKKLSDKMRYELRPEIEASAISWAIGIVDQHEIDEINILNASFLAMHRAIAKLKTRPELLLIDGNRFKPYKKILGCMKCFLLNQILHMLRKFCKARRDIINSYKKSNNEHCHTNSNSYPILGI